MRCLGVVLGLDPGAPLSGLVLGSSRTFAAADAPVGIAFRDRLEAI
jgi:hypothetical protein